MFTKRYWSKFIIKSGKNSKEENLMKYTNHQEVKHILDCTDDELLTFQILKKYKGHLIRIKPITDIPLYKIHKMERSKMYINNGNKVKRELNVLFQIGNGFEVNLGIITQELIEDSTMFNYFIKERLKYIGSYLNNL